MHAYQPSVSDEAIEAKTGKTWGTWFRLLDNWGADKKGHKATAVWVQETHGVSGWWAQSITVEYERARGLREVGQKSSGDFAVSAQRTLAASPAEVMAWWLEGSKREAWLHDEILAPAVTLGMKTPKTSKTAMGDVLRFRVRPDGAPNEHRVDVTFAEQGVQTQVRLQHEAIASKEERDALKARWGTELDRMKKHIEAVTPAHT